MSDEEVLNTFFDLLETEQQSKGFKSIKEVFTDQEKAKIDLKELINGLNKIGIKETDSTVEIIKKKFKDYFSSDLININGLISNYELYLEEKKKKSIPKPNFSFNPNHTNYAENLVEPRESPFSPPKDLKKDEEVKSNSSKKDEEAKSNNSKKVEEKAQSAIGTPITESVVIKDDVNKNLDRFSFRDPNLINQENKQELQEDKSKNTRTPSFLTHSTNPLERIENVNNKLMQDLSENTNFKLLDIYELFATLVRRTGLMLEQTFTMKDIRKDKFLPQIEYNIVFKSFNLNFTEEQKIVIFQDLPQKDDGRLNYRYFLDKIYKYDPIDKFKFIRNYNHLYNDYINFLRKFIRDNQINVTDLWKKNFQERDINKDEFKKLLNEISFNFYEPIEVENIFNLLNDNGKIKLTELINILMLDPLDVKSSVMSVNKMSSWKDKIILFDAAKANEYKKSFTHLIKVFDEIRKRLIKEKIEDLFNSIFVTIDGECDEMDFIHIMGKYNVGKSSYFINFLEFFKNKKSKRFEVITFLNAYNSIYFEGGESIPTEVSLDKNLNLSKTLIQEKQPQANTNQVASKTAPSNFNNKNDRGVSDDDLEYIKDVVNFIEPIITNEKRKSVIEFFKGYDKQRVGYFSKDIFMKILDDLEVDTQGGDEINVFINYLVDLKNPLYIRIDRIIEVFKQLSEFKGNIGNENESIENKGTKKDANEQKIVQELTNFLINNRIIFVDLFNDSSDSLPHTSIKTAFAKINFPYTPDDLNQLLLFLDPTNKGSISLSSLKKLISNYRPDYFEMPFQKIDQNSLTNKLINQPQLKVFIEKIKDYISTSKITIQEYLDKVTRTNPKYLNQKEFTDLIKSTIQVSEEKDILEFFTFLDLDKGGKISTAEFSLHFNNATLTEKEKKEKIKISDNIRDNINLLFDHFDTDKSGTISKNELFTALKAANHNITMADVEVIMKKVDKDRSNTIDRNEFITIMEEHFKEEQYLFDEEKNYILNLFKEETQDNVGFLTLQQFKNLLSNKLNLDLTETELNELIQTTDCNFDGMIDIEEFVRLIDAAEQVKSVGKTIRSIKMQKKFNPLMFLNIFHGLPINFIPSFLRECEKSLKVTPSATLRPVTDATGILYEDIVMDSDLKKKSLTSLKQISTVVNCKIQFVKATGVPIPDESALDRKQNIVGRLLKMGLFNNSKNLFFGNTLSITCKWSEDYEDRWNFIDDNRYNFNNNILIRYNNQEEMKSVSVIFEFVLLVKKEGKISEVSSGWSEVNVGELMKKEKFTLNIEGGSPLKKQSILQNDVRSKRSGWGKVSQFFSGKVVSQLIFESKVFKELNDQDRSEINYLPSTIILPRASLNMCAVYRKFIAKHILNNSSYSLKSIRYQQPIINNFCCLIDCPDTFEILTDLWRQYVMYIEIKIREAASSSQKKDEVYWEKSLEDYVDRCYSVLYADKFEYDLNDPCKGSYGNAILGNNRKILINSTIKSDKVKSSSKENIENIEQFTSFKPFSIQEFITNKVCITKKITDVYELSIRDNSVMNANTTNNINHLKFNIDNNNTTTNNVLANITNQEKSKIESSMIIDKLQKAHDNLANEV